MEQDNLLRYRKSQDIFLRDVHGGLLSEATSILRKKNFRPQRPPSKDNDTKRAFAVLYNRFILTANRYVFKNYAQGYYREDISTEEKVIKYAKTHHIESWVFVKSENKILCFDPNDVINDNWGNERIIEVEDKKTGEIKEIKIPMLNYSIRLATSAFLLGRDILS